MAKDFSDMSSDEENAYYAQRNASDQAFRDSISTPEGRAAYDQQVAQRWSDIQNHTNGYEQNGGGGFLGALESVMDPIMTNVIKYGPYVFAAAAGGSALGLFGDGAAAGMGAGEAAGAGFGSAAGDVALGNAAIDSAGLQSLGFLDGMTAGGAGLGATAGAGAGLGSMIGIEGGAPAVVSVGAPAATGGGIGLGGAAAGAAGLGGMIGTQGGPPAVVQVSPPANTSNGPLSPLGAAAGGVGAGALLESLAGGTDPVTGAPGPTNQQTAPGDATGTTPPVVVPPGGGLPSGLPGLGDILGGLGGLLGGNVDRIKAQQDADWWKSQLDELGGMYKPGTPEATQMEQKMSAMDAATGRNNQYGVRAVNLASNLADKRAGIMTSAGYQNMANAYRGRSSQDLNGLFGALGNSGTTNLLNSLGSGLSSYFNSTPPTR